MPDGVVVWDKEMNGGRNVRRSRFVGSTGDGNRYQGRLPWVFYCSWG